MRKKVLAEVQFDNKGIQKVENKKENKKSKNSIFHFNKKSQSQIDGKIKNLNKINNDKNNGIK